MSNSKKYQAGLEKIREVIGENGEKAVNSFQDIAPDLTKYIIEFPFGEIYSRTGLDLQKKQLVTLSSLVTQGDTEQALGVHIGGALNVGLTPTEIIEAFLQLLPYAGWPRVQNAVNVAAQVFEERQVTPEFNHSITQKGSAENEK